MSTGSRPRCWRRATDPFQLVGAASVFAADQKCRRAVALAVSERRFDRPVRGSLDRSPRPEGRWTFTVDPAAQCSAIEAFRSLISILYLRGISSGDFQEALSALLGKDAANLSPAVFGRLKAMWKGEFGRWQQHDLSARRYVYIWADGVYLQARMGETLRNGEPRSNAFSF